MADALDLSQLEIEPHLMQPRGEDCGYYVKEYRLWKLSLNGKLLTDVALPFFATQSLIQLDIDPCNPFLEDGNKFVFVRQSGRYVIWYGANDPELYYGHTPDALHQNILTFDKAHYTAVIDAQAPTPEQVEIYRRPGALPPDHLPDLKLDEIKQLFLDRYHNVDKTLAFAEADDAIYRIPEHPNDSRGYWLIYRLWKAILEAENPAIAVCDPPETWIELRIGLDLPGVPEAVWWVGKIEGRAAVRFIAYPSFPLWLGGQAIETAFSNDPLFA